VLGIKEDQMERNLKETLDGWEISLNRNIHMYTHALSVKNGVYKLNIDCEDLPTDVKTIGIWLYNLDVPDALKTELKDLLLKWTMQFEVDFQIYISRDKFVTNAHQ
jgi:hypothetical protein